MIHYATLHQVKQYLGILSTETTDDVKLTSFIRQSGRSIDKRCRRRFDVRKETRSFDMPSVKMDRIGTYSIEDLVYQLNAAGELDSRRLRLDDDLLEVVTLTNGDDNEITSGYYVLLPANDYPKFAIRLRDDSDVGWEPSSGGSRQQVIDVSGLWGYHQYYGDDDDGWVDTLDTVQDNPLSANATSITVSDADGEASDLEDTRFQKGNLIKVGDEFIFVRATNTTTNVLTVLRGYHGTTAAAHAQNDVVYVFRPWADIVLATIRLCAWRYRQKDVDIFDKANIIGTGISISPSAMPPDVLELLPAPKPPRL